MANGGHAASQAWPTARTGWYATLLLTLAYTLSFIDRQILNLLVEPVINHVLDGPQGQRGDGAGGVRPTGSDEDTAVDHVEIGDIVEASPAVHHRGLRIITHAGRTGLVLAAATNYTDSIAVAAVSPKPVPIGITTVEQFAIGFVNIAVPSAAGRVATNARYFQSFGINAVTSTTTGAITGFVGFVAQAILVVLTILAFASIYLIMSNSDETAFSEQLGHTSALYFSMTTATTMTGKNTLVSANAARKPPKAKMTAFVCSGRRRPKVVQGSPRLAGHHASCRAMITPTSMPTIPHTTVMMVNWRTTR